MTRLRSILRKTAVWFWHPARRSMFVSAVCHATVLVVLGYVAIEAKNNSAKFERPLNAQLVGRTEVPTEAQAFLNIPQSNAATSSDASSGGSNSPIAGMTRVVPGGESKIKVIAGGALDLSSKGYGQGRDPLGIGAGVKGVKLFKEANIRNPSSVSFFGATAGGNDFVFVVDLSGSMTGDRFARAEAELERSVKSLYEPQRFYVIFFNQVDFLMPTQGLIPATGVNQRDAIKWFRTAQCGGGTEPLNALQEAVRLKPNAIFFLTDGEFSPEVVTLIQPDASVTKPIPIHCIAFASHAGEFLLKAIAQVSGGSYRYVP